MKKRILTCICLPLCLVGPTRAQNKVIRGHATYYSLRLNGRKTANGERLQNDSMTCAHLKFPFGTRLRVVNPANGKEVVVRVNDRGPYSKKYTIDLTQAAARQLDIIHRGTAQVEITVLEDEPAQESTTLNLDMVNADSLMKVPTWIPTDTLTVPVPLKAGSTVEEGTTVPKRISSPPRRRRVTPAKRNKYRAKRRSTRRR